MKKNLDYYQHDANSHNHPKFKMLRLRYKWEGEGKFWALNNMVAKSESCKLNLNKGYNKAIIASDLDFNMEEFDEFLKYLAKDCKLIKMKGGVITTETTQENYERVHGDRVEARKRYERKTSAKISEVPKTSGENSKTSGEKVYKLNKTKLNKIKLNKIKSNQTKGKEKKSGRMDFLKIDQEHSKANDELNFLLNGKTEEKFQKFWKFYNKREGDVKKVRSVFQELIKTEADYNDLIKATRNYNELTANRELKYLKMPVNFLATYKDFIEVNN